MVPSDKFQRGSTRADWAVVVIIIGVSLLLGALLGYLQPPVFLEP